MSEWKKGNTPSYHGWYWVTVNEADNVKMYDEPMHFFDGAWSHSGKRYCKSNIIAYAPCNRPKEAFDGIEDIGYAEQFYLRIKINGITRYLSKGYQSPRWSKTGYSTREKAAAALRRLKKTEPEYGYQGQKSEFAIVNGRGQEV